MTEEFKSITELMKGQVPGSITLEDVDGDLFTPYYTDCDGDWCGLTSDRETRYVRPHRIEWKVHTPKPKLHTYYYCWHRYSVGSGSWSISSAYASTEVLRADYEGRGWETSEPIAVELPE